MQRVINDADFVVDDMLEGFIRANKNLIRGTENKRVIMRAKDPETPRVGIITGGGSGHEPAFLGFVGKNMLDAAAVGEVFSSPTANAFVDAARAVDQGKGVACLYGNYAGDNMNVKMAVRLAQKEGITIKTVVANDDAASAPLRERDKRRGAAGEIMMWKCACAKAAEGAELDEVIRVAQKTIDATRSVGIGLTSCTIPAVGQPNFVIESGTMELGIGHHGEPGVKVVPMETAKRIAARMWDVIEGEDYFHAEDEMVVVLSGLGATPLMEQYILYNEIEKLMTTAGIAIYKAYVGDIFTSLEMMGVSVTITKVDAELKKLVEKETACCGLVHL